MGGKRNNSGSSDDRGADRTDQGSIGRAPRYRVEIVIVSQRYTGPSHTFTSRAKAEAFARAVSHYLPAAQSPSDLAPAWVLVYALATPEARLKVAMQDHCYLCFDAGEILVKRHEILAGCYGYVAPRAGKESAHA